jgi:hypothetical protein
MMALGRGSGGGTAALRSLFVSFLHPDHLLDDDGHLGAFVREVARISR